MDRVMELLDDLEETLGNGHHDSAVRLLKQVRGKVGDLLSYKEDLLLLAEINRDLASVLDPDILLESMMDRAIELLTAERGFVVLKQEGTQPFSVAVARQFDEVEMADARATVSFRLVEKVMASGTPLVTTNAQDDVRLKGSESIIAFGIRSVMAVPLKTDHELIGAIYVDTRIKTKTYTESELILLQALADQAAIALRMARLYQELKDR